MFDEWRAYLESWRWLLAAALIVAVAALGIGAAGGLRSVDTRAVPRVAPGRRVVCDDWFLRAVKASIVTTTPLGTHAENGGAFLLLEAEAENRTRKTRVDIGDAFRWQNGARDRFGSGIVADQVILLRDPALESSLQPGLADRIALVWKLPPGKSASGDQVWQLIGRTWLAKDKVNGGGNWLRSHAVAEVAFTVVDPRDASAPSR